MTQDDLYAIIKEQVGYGRLRPLKDVIYHDGISYRQIEQWRKGWWRGAWFGLINPVPDYTPESFDCDDIAADFVAYCRRQNAYSRKALPMCVAFVQGHALVLFVDDSGVRFFDPNEGESPLVDEGSILYLEGL